MSFRADEKQILSLEKTGGLFERIFGKFLGILGESLGTLGMSKKYSGRILVEFWRNSGEILGHANVQPRQDV